MAIPVDSRRGRIALMVAHCAGMVDLVALSIWAGALITHYGFDPQRAGGLPTLFLGGAVLASVTLGRRARIRQRSAGVLRSWPRCTWSQVSRPVPGACA